MSPAKPHSANPTAAKSSKALSKVTTAKSLPKHGAAASRNESSTPTEAFDIDTDERTSSNSKRRGFDKKLVEYCFTALYNDEAKGELRAELKKDLGSLTISPKDDTYLTLQQKVVQKLGEFYVKICEYTRYSPNSALERIVNLSRQEVKENNPEFESTYSLQNAPEDLHLGKPDGDETKLLKPTIRDCFVNRLQLKQAIVLLYEHTDSNYIRLPEYLILYVKKAIQKRIRQLIHSIIPPPEKVKTNEHANGLNNEENNDNAKTGELESGVDIHLAVTGGIEGNISNNDNGQKKTKKLKGNKKKAKEAQKQSINQDAIGEDDEYDEDDDEEDNLRCLKTYLIRAILETEGKRVLNYKDGRDRCSIHILYMSIQELIRSPYYTTHPPCHITCIIGCVEPLYDLLAAIGIHRNWASTLQSFSFLVPHRYININNEQEKLPIIQKRFEQFLGERWRFCKTISNNYSSVDDDEGDRDKRYILIYVSDLYDALKERPDEKSVLELCSIGERVYKADFGKTDFPSGSHPTSVTACRELVSTIRPATNETFLEIGIGTPLLACILSCVTSSLCIATEIQSAVIEIFETVIEARNRKLSYVPSTSRPEPNYSASPGGDDNTLNTRKGRKKSRLTEDDDENDDRANIENEAPSSNTLPNSTT